MSKHEIDEETEIETETLAGQEAQPLPLCNHLTDMGDKWFPLLGDPQKMINGVIGTTLLQGGTRPAWSVKNAETETMLMAWPENSLLRSSVVVHGGNEAKLAPVAVVPLMEGFVNNLTVIDSYPWQDGHIGEVLAQPGDDADPLWFFDPLFFRDKDVDLTRGVVQPFYLSGMCYMLRRALLDEMTVTTGPNYEAHAAGWLEANPGKTRLDVPQLKISLVGLRVLAPTPNCAEYQGRGHIFDVDSFSFGPEGAEVKVHRFGITFGATENPFYVVLYASERVCVDGYEPKENDEVDVVFWMQGRIADIGDEVPGGIESPDIAKDSADQ